ncbi:MAG: DNA polymerase IV [Thaumarchaeota archaeon]|nr:DNA polymerase IV [Nitrososphaerota archaeon]
MKTLLTRIPPQLDGNDSVVDRQPSAANARIIAHIDMDSFYASAEARRNPALKDKPVVIGAEPKEGKGRGVVISCNYAARKFGLRSAMPISEAWRLCPDAVYLHPDFEYYESLSSEVMKIIKSKVRVFEQVSIDEAFVDLAGVASTFEDAGSWMIQLKAELKSMTGLTCSIGLAETKSAAKIATDLHKPDGITVIGPGQIRQSLAVLPISVIPGVGMKTELTLKDLGVAKVGDLQTLDPAVLKRRLGTSGLWLWEVANGIENYPVREHELKSLSTERTFEEDTEDWGKVDELVSGLASELASRASLAHVIFRKVGIKIRFRGFETHTRETRLATFSSDGKVIAKEASSMLHEFQDKKRPVRLVGLKVSELRTETADQTSITAWLEKKERAE